jgi:hypothetical protein
MVTSEPVEVSVRVIILGVPLFWLAVKFGEIGITKNLPKYKKF